MRCPSRPGFRPKCAVISDTSSRTHRNHAASSILTLLLRTTTEVRMRWLSFIAESESFPPQPNATDIDLLEDIFPPKLPDTSLGPNQQSKGPLSKRQDVCTNAFGDGWMRSTCAPGKTLCCKSMLPDNQILWTVSDRRLGVNERQSYPQCQQHLGLGWCCTEE